MKRTYQPSKVAPRAHARVSRPDEDGRRPQGSGGSPRQGPRAPARLTAVAPAARGGGSSRFRLSRRRRIRVGVRARRSPRRAFPAIDRRARRAGSRPRRLCHRTQGDAARRRSQPPAPPAARERCAPAGPAIERFDIILRVRQRVRRDDIAARGRRIAASCSRGSSDAPA